MLTTVNDYIDAGLTHSIHTSERKSFRGCRRRWDWISRQFYYPRVTARPLEFGVAFHAATEKYYEFYLGLFVNPDPNAALQLALAEFKKVTLSQRTKYINNNGGIDEAMDVDYRDRVVQGEGMLKYYFGNIAPMADKGLKPLKVEIKFEVPISDPDTGEMLWCKCDWCWRRFAKHVQKTNPGMIGFDKVTWKGLPVTYGGRIDILFEDSLGRLWIGDWKTAARLSGTEVADEYLWNDDQITAYVWALRSIGLKVAGFIYAEIKKAVPEEPEPMKHSRLGRLYSISKSQNTTVELYEGIVKEGDPEAYENGLYDEFLEFLREEAPRFHSRHLIERNDDECRNAARDIYLEARDMTNPQLPIYPNSGRFHCKGFGPSSGCAFWEPCLGKNRGEDYQYSLNTMFDKLDRHYWETAEATTDKRMDPA